MLNIAIIGSCVSRLAFRSDFVPSAKKIFSVKNYQFHTSIISLMAQSIAIDRSKVIGNDEPLYRDHLVSEFEKDGLNDLIACNPDYIILDFYPDVHFGIISIKDTYLTNKVFRFKKFKVFGDFEIESRLHPTDDLNAYLDLWKESFDKFVEFCKNNLQDTKIIINKTRFNDELFDGLNYQVKKQNFEFDINKRNEIWDLLDNYAEEKHNLPVLDMKGNYFLDKYHMHGLDPVHFCNNFYRDFIDNLIIYIFNEKISFGGRKNKLSANLIRNHDFKNGSLYWTHFDENFFVNDGVLKYKCQNLNKNQHAQVISNAVEISGQADVVLSFNFSVSDFEELSGEKNIFYIRSYKDKAGLWSKDAIDSFYISVKDAVAMDGYFSVNKKIAISGRYLKVGAYVAGNGEVAWWDISLRRIF